MMRKILHVGSDRALADMTGKLLQRNGYDVRCAVGADEAIAALREHAPDAVVADLEVCHADGMRFCRAVKQCAKAIRLLFISASDEDEIALLNAGADDWMKKPYKMNVLYARLRALLR